MLAGADRVLAWITWIAAGLVVLMLLVGPRVVAQDKAQNGAGAAAAYSSSSGAPSGRALFTQNCGTCHTLKAAGTTGGVGPDLDGVPLDANAIADTVRQGRGAMPSFSGRLSSQQVAAVAAFVAASK